MKKLEFGKIKKVLDSAVLYRQKASTEQCG